MKNRDPLTVLRCRMLDAGIGEDEVDAAEQEERDRIDRAVDLARESPAPTPEALTDHVICERERAVTAGTTGPEEGSGGEDFRTMDAVRLALRHELAADPSVFLAGIDVGAGGNVFGVTRGLFDDFPGRVLDSPICETALVGVAVGAAMAGMRPIVEIMYMDFIGVCFDQLMNQAAKLRYMTGAEPACRSSYGPSSERVARRGANTRRASRRCSRTSRA